MEMALSNSARTGRRSGGRRSTALLFVPCLLSVVIGAFGAARVAAWRDEYATFLFTSQPTGRLVRSVGHVDLVLSPFYLLARGLVVLGVHGTWLRAPSVLAGAGSVLVVTVLARRWFGQRGGFVAGVILALNPLMVQLSTDARPVAPAVLSALAATLVLDRRLEGDDVSGRRSWWGYAALLAVAGLLQLFTVLVVTAHAVLVTRRRHELRHWALSCAAAAAVVLPLAVAGSRQREQVGWIPAPDPRRAAGTLLNLVDYQQDGVLGATGVLAGLAFAVTAVIAVLGSRGDARRQGHLLAALTLTAGPWAVLLATSVIAFPVLTSHYVAVSCAGPALVVGAAASSVSRTSPASGRAVARSGRLPRRTLGVPASAKAMVAAAGVLVAVTTVDAGRTVGARVWQDDYPGLARVLQRDARAGDLVVVVQHFEENGVAAAVATTVGDQGWLDVLRSRLADGAQPVVDVRRVVATRPLRTADVPAVDSRGTGSVPRRAWIVSVAGRTLPARTTTLLRDGGCGVEDVADAEVRAFGADRLRVIDCPRT